MVLCDIAGADRRCPHSLCAAVVLRAMLQETVGHCMAVVGLIGEEELLRIYPVQGRERRGYDILLLASEHVSYHAGQIAWFSEFLFHGVIDFCRVRDLSAG